jgi:hypothetical protein
VTVAIIGLSFKKCDKILLYDNNIVENVKFISPYLIKDVNVIIQPQPNPPRGFPPLVMGNKPSDDGNLILSEKEVDELVFAYPESKNYIKKFVSADDFINGNYRYCLWIEPNEEHEAKKIPLIKNRTDKLFHFRSGSKAKSTRDYAPFDYRFRQISYKQSHGIVIPTVSSERRKYIPLAYVDQNTVVSNATSIIYDANIWLFAVLHSRIHMAWVRAISGRLEERIRYSSQLCYNTFPFPSINNSQKQQLEILGYKILEEREKYSEKTLAQLYDPEKMPAGLREVHNELDLAVEKCYRSKLFENDEERLEFLLKQYEQVLDIQKSKGTLFEPEVSFKQKKKK